MEKIQKLHIVIATGLFLSVCHLHSCRPLKFNYSSTAVYGIGTSIREMVNVHMHLCGSASTVELEKMIQNVCSVDQDASLESQPYPVWYTI